ncbi:MAG: hypothetical protein LBI71_01260 [Enterobacteriaceae bacterium]|jgi:hypothetical protein|nr:hypothetical protein [Enterobacteriaceae bacterium]
MSESIKDILEEVLRESRRFFNLKSGNKIYPDLSRVKETKRNFYSIKAINERKSLINKTYQESRLRKKPCEISNVILRVQGEINHAGNCDQYAVKAFELLRERMERIADIYSDKFSILAVGIMSNRAESNFGHTFLMLANYHFNRNQLPNIFQKNINSEAWICDPWANIVCQSHQYPLEWNIKMLKWRAKGKFFSLSEYYNPLSPTNVILPSVDPACYNLMRFSGNSRRIIYGIKYSVNSE